MIDYTKAFVTKDKKGFDEGLRTYILKIYNYMTMALLLTGVMAFCTLHFPPLMNIMYNIGPNGEILGNSIMGVVVTLAPLAIALYFTMGMGKMSVKTAYILFWVYAGLMGMSLSCLGLMYTGQSLIKTFFICSSVFGAMSLYGYTTKKDLTSMGSFLFMGLVGLIIASLSNLFFQSSAIDFVVSFIGVGIFMGLTAWDTQKLKALYYSSGGDEMGQKVSLIGAFTLYLDFINMFIFMLKFFGNKK